MATRGSAALIVGGIRSGKSVCGEQLALQLPAPHFYLATAPVNPSDEEMQRRIGAHKARRASQGWSATIESADLRRVFAEAPHGSTWLIECLSLWLAVQAFPESGEMRDEAWVHAEMTALLDLWQERGLHVVAVSAEAGLGLIPMDKVGRRWVDVLGRMNQTFASRADQVWFCSCGIPLQIKGNRP